jgi:hypothetical protein
MKVNWFHWRYNKIDPVSLLFSYAPVTPYPPEQHLLLQWCIDRQPFKLVATQPVHQQIFQQDLHEGADTLLISHEKSRVAFTGPGSARSLQAMQSEK